jgi:hypothetical protein
MSGRADLKAEEHDERYNYYLSELVGRAGLEKVLDPLLRGEAGARLLRVDVTGYRRDDLGQRPPKPGDDVMLTLDTTVQQLAEDALNGVPGAIVVLDPRNGDVLAMASSPGFDPNQFVPVIRSSDWGPAARQPVDAADEPRGGRRLRARQHLQAHHRPGRPAQRQGPRGRPARLPRLLPARPHHLPLLEAQRGTAPSRCRRRWSSPAMSTAS